MSNPIDITFLETFDEQVARDGRAHFARRFLALFPLTISVLSGCTTSSEPNEVVATEYQALSAANPQNASGAAAPAPSFVVTREAQMLSAEEAQMFFQGPPKPLGPAPSLQDAFAAIKSSAHRENVRDLIRDYMRAVAQLPVEQQPAARQQLQDYFANAGSSTRFSER
jgi:hypothetical protein